MNKLLLIICEGTSDRVTLYAPTKNFIKTKKLAIQTSITHGDIALKEDATIYSCVEEIKKIIEHYKTAYCLFPSDFFGVYHVIDTDGAFSTGDVYREIEKGYFFDEENGFIFTDSIYYTKIRNSIKRDVYDYLKTVGKIANIRYRVLFFSRNLEHALYGKANCSSNEKIELSNSFELKYGTDSKSFYDVMKKSSYNVPSEYADSWNYIMNGTNSIRKGNNYIVLLDELFA